MADAGKLPIRVGVFATVAQATQAIDRLLAAGFDQEQISVISSDKTKEQYFEDFKNPPLTREQLPQAVAAGGAIGALLAGLTAVAGLATTMGIGIVALGPILVALGAGAVSGGLIGAMMTRGFSKELTEYYDQAVTSGKILVAVEHEGKEGAETLSKAEVIFREAGAEPVPLQEG